MLRKNQKALQMNDNGIWKFVFCYVVNQGNKIAFTENRQKALNASDHLTWFKNHYANNEFRAI